MIGIVTSMITCAYGVLRDIGGITFRLVLEGVVIFSASPRLLSPGCTPPPLTLSWVGNIEDLSPCVDPLWRNCMVSLYRGIIGRTVDLYVSLQGVLYPN